MLSLINDIRQEFVMQLKCDQNTYSTVGILWVFVCLLGCCCCLFGFVFFHLFVIFVVVVWFCMNRSNSV